MMRTLKLLPAIILLIAVGCNSPAGIDSGAGAGTAGRDQMQAPQPGPDRASTNTPEAYGCVAVKNTYCTVRVTVYDDLGPQSENLASGQSAHWGVITCTRQVTVRAIFGACKTSKVLTLDRNGNLSAKVVRTGYGQIDIEQV